MINLTPALTEALLTILMNIYVGLENGGIEVHAEKAGITKQKLKRVLEAALYDFGIQARISLMVPKSRKDNLVIFPSTPIEA